MNTEQIRREFERRVSYPPSISLYWGEDGYPALSPADTGVEWRLRGLWDSLKAGAALGVKTERERCAGLSREMSVDINKGFIVVTGATRMARRGYNAACSDIAAAIEKG